MYCIIRTYRTSHRAEHKNISHGRSPPPLSNHLPPNSFVYLLPSVRLHLMFVYLLSSHIPLRKSFNQIKAEFNLENQQNIFIHLYYILEFTLAKNGKSENGLGWDKQDQAKISLRRVLTFIWICSTSAMCSLRITFVPRKYIYT